MANDLDGRQKTIDPEVLRKRHPVFTYESYSMQRHSDRLEIEFHFTIAPDLDFKATATLQVTDRSRLASIPPAVLDNLVFHLGLVESLSYWKATCSPKIVVRAGYLSLPQVEWWRSLFLNGLREFFFVNGIDYRRRDLFSIEIASQDRHDGLLYEEALPDDTELVFISGGKDSAFTMEFLREENKKLACLLLNPAPAALAIAAKAKSDSIIVNRTIDPRLLELNNCGYLNGHTPFSAYLAFLGVLCAAVYGHRNVIVSNERSCNAPVTTYLGADVIHQYSKTFSFESMLATYAKEYLLRDVNYFSILRPLFELQVVRLFSQYPKYFPDFLSCNRGAAENRWCCECAKCLSIYASIYPFVSKEQVEGIFGSNLFDRADLVPLVGKLLGVDGVRPLECVGATEELLVAFYLCLQKAKKDKTAVPIVLRSFEETVLPKFDHVDRMCDAVLGGWSDQHSVPGEFAKRLRARSAGSINTQCVA